MTSPLEPVHTRDSALEVLRPRGVPDVVVHRGEHVRDAFNPHFHGETHITCVLAGGRAQTIGHARHELGPGDVVLVPAGEVHGGASPGWSFVAIYCAPEALEHATRELPGKHRDTTPAIRQRDPRVLRRALEFTASLPGAPLACQSTWISLIACLMRDGAEPPPVRCERAAVRRVREFLDEHLAAAVDLQALASLARVSREHLVRSFTAELGMPPHAYHINVRIERAKARLLRGEAIVDVAHALGFHDQSHFSRHFRRIVGVPPGLLARQFRTRPGADSGASSTGARFP